MLLGTSDVMPSRDELLLPCIDVSTYSDSLAVPALGETQPACSSRSEKLQIFSKQ